MDTARYSFHPADALGLVVDLIQRDAAARRFDAWGTSTVVDDNIGAPLIDQALFTTLHETAAIDAAFPIGNAGVIHMYGYWFSTVSTPYGLKRDRWQEPDLAEAFGLAPNAFHLDAETRTTPLERLTDVVLPLLLDPPGDAAVVDATLGARYGNRLSRVILIHAPHTRIPALIYGIAPAGNASDAARLKLLTVFPVQGDYAPMLKDFAHNPRPRWNAVG